MQVAVPRLLWKRQTTATGANRPQINHNVIALMKVAVLLIPLCLLERIVATRGEGARRPCGEKGVADIYGCPVP